MNYMSQPKYGSVEGMEKKELIIDPHMYTAPVGTIRYGPKDNFGKRQLVFWRTKTRCSSKADWMELHDAQTGATLWRAESRYADRAAPVTSPLADGTERTEFLTVVRLYLEQETAPRLMIVHRDLQPGGLQGRNCSRVLAVYMLDPNASANANNAGNDGPTHEELFELFDFAALPAGEDIFQLTVNATFTAVNLAALRLPPAEELEKNLEAGAGIKVRPEDVRTLARLKSLAGIGNSINTKRKVEVDGGLDLPLVTMLLCATDQLLLCHEAIDYDVDWPEDYGYAYGECFSARKKDAEALVSKSEFGMQTGYPGQSSKEDNRNCFCF